ncbi:MAG TPA: phosphoheptose isomerase [Cytophagales bacterium]|nr:phosphoheptose isomerase [Cytophagales bacterium]HAA21147.1 phosphoheptose isomerase [Cytophagales bacterium]HAP65257.1 phosphoheptose isomerase [Cytophagales bacterium]
MNTALTAIEEELTAQGFQFERKDLERPWGGFWAIDREQLDQFIRVYFQGIVEPQADQDRSPKILAVAPQKRLSWQYHHRRSEIWRVVSGEVGVIKSDTDEQGPLQTYRPGDVIRLAQGERHRLVGLKDWATVSEIWVHTDPNHPSDEDDIVRINDDFGR